MSSNNKWSAIVLAASASLMLVACSGKKNAGTANRKPTISGSPAGSLVAGESYSFTPSASDPDADELTFSISGKPSWATFATTTGALTGIAEVGSWPNIVITVSDARSAVSLAPFTITVSAPSGTAMLSWVSPTENTDGSTLTDLAGFRIYHGTSPNTLSQVAEVPDATATTYTFNDMAPGDHYFAVSAYNQSKGESPLSAAGSKTIQ